MEKCEHLGSDLSGIVNSNRQSDSNLNARTNERSEIPRWKLEASIDRPNGTLIDVQFSLLNRFFQRSLRVTSVAF